MTIKEQLDKYIHQRDEVEIMIDKYINLYQKLDGAVEALHAVLENENKTAEESGGTSLVGEA